MAYLGVPGRMHNVRCVSDESVEHIRPSSLRTTMAGRVKAQVGPRVSRSWGLRLGAVTSAAEAAVVTGFVYGDFGDGPWWWYSDMSMVTNILPPEVSLLRTGQAAQDGVRDSFAMHLPDGSIAGNSVYVEPSQTAHLTYKDDAALNLPTIPGQPFTASSFFDAGVGRLNVQTLLANGRESRSIFSDESRGVGVQRTQVTFVPTIGEVAFRVRVITDDMGVQVARPAVTLTKTPTEWAIGGGVQKAIITQQTADTTMAWDKKQLVGSDYTIMEVG